VCVCVCVCVCVFVPSSNPPYILMSGKRQQRAQNAADDDSKSAAGAADAMSTTSVSRASSVASLTASDAGSVIAGIGALPSVTHAQSDQSHSKADASPSEWLLSGSACFGIARSDHAADVRLRVMIAPCIISPQAPPLVSGQAPTPPMPALLRCPLLHQSCSPGQALAPACCTRALKR